MSKFNFIIGDVNENDEKCTSLRNAALASCKDMLEACDVQIGRPSSRKLSKSAPSMSKKKTDQGKRERLQSAYPTERPSQATSKEVCIQIEDFDLNIPNENDWSSIDEKETEEVTEVIKIYIHKNSEAENSWEEDNDLLASLQNKRLMNLMKSSLPRPSVSSIQSNVSELYLDDKETVRKISTSSILSFTSVYENESTSNKQKIASSSISSAAILDILRQMDAEEGEIERRDETMKEEMNITRNEEAGDVHQWYENEGLENVDEHDKKIDDTDRKVNEIDVRENQEEDMSFFDFLNESSDGKGTESTEVQQLSDSIQSRRSSTPLSSRLSSRLNDVAEFLGRFSLTYPFRQTSIDDRPAENRNVYRSTVKRSIVLILYLLIGLLPQAIVKVVVNLVDYKDVIVALTICENVAFVYYALLPYVYIACNSSLKKKLSSSYRLNMQFSSEA